MHVIQFIFSDGPDAVYDQREWAIVPQIGWRVELREQYGGHETYRRDTTTVAGIVTGVMSSDFPRGTDQRITVFLQRVDTLEGDPR